ncbi:hypothetical protein [Tunicatimonas pelagia]|uniref:hypothetical protein n=1 Tax=Tunicatimonas pelagia TaxID=931531 RepID=UPI0026669A12|nr:hypothetical protein [Tunicatimonas pelagia]WKN46473.1 hypothetical protein P0M28_30450 [Tunicatimonas pelagia]
MAKKSVVADLPSASRGRKKLTRNILSESFKESYPEETEAAKAIADADQKKESDVENSNSTVSVDEDKNTQPTDIKTNDEKKSSEKAPVAKRKGTRKKAKVEEAGTVEMEQPIKEFTTLNCLKPTHARIAIVSALLREPVYKILEEALNDYVTKQKKSGKITLDI